MCGTGGYIREREGVEATDRCRYPPVHDQIDTAINFSVAERERGEG